MITHGIIHVDAGSELTISAIIGAVLVCELRTLFLVSLPVFALAFPTAVHSYEALATLLVSIFLAAFCARHGL